MFRDSDAWSLTHVSHADVCRGNSVCCVWINEDKSLSAESDGLYKLRDWITKVCIATPKRWSHTVMSFVCKLVSPYMWKKYACMCAAVKLNIKNKRTYLDIKWDVMADFIFKVCFEFICLSVQEELVFESGGEWQMAHLVLSPHHLVMAPRAQPDALCTFPGTWQCFLVYPVSTNIQSATTQHSNTPNKLECCSN